MPDETSTSGEGSLPPKLDLRKTGVLKGHVWPAPDDNADEESADTQPTAAPAQADAAPSQPSSEESAPRPAAPPSATPADAANSPTPSQGKTEAAGSVPVARLAKTSPGTKPQVAKPVAPQAKAQAPGPKAAKPAAPPAKPAAAKPAAAAAPKPSTARIKVPSEDEKKQAAQPPAPTAAPAEKSTSGGKHETSKIPLEMASAPPAGKKGTSTIKIKPAVKPSAAARKAMPAAADAAEKKPASGAPEGGASKAKKQTSRIPLESALAADSSGKKQGGGAPKTIRLKRPGSTSTVKAAPPAETKPETETGAEKKPQDDSKEEASPDKGKLGKTSRLDAAASEEEPATPTRKKTIRVKRPTQETSAKKKLSVARPEGTPAEAGGPQGLQPPAPIEAPPEQVGGFFGLCGIAATLVAVAVIYMLLAQVLGSHPSLTELSYGAPGVDLPWAGEIETK